MRSLISTLPWTIPGLVLAALLAAVAARRAGRILGTSAWVAAALIVSIGLIIAATIPPDAGASPPASAHRSCDLTRMGLAPLGSYLRFSEISLNVLLFVPLGVTLTLLPAGRPRSLLIAGGLVAPLVIEVTQLLVPALGRGCQAGDVIDNTLGLLIGMAAGVVGRRAASRIGRSRGGPNTG